MIIGLFILLGILPNLSQAYIKTRASNGNVIKWSLPKKISYFGNSVNNSGLSSTDVFNSIVRGLETWKEATGGLFNFEYTQGTDGATYFKNSDYNQKNTIYFGDLDPGVIGMTQLWFNNGTGEMLETDIQLNDVDFYFTENPADTTSTSGNVNGRRKVYINNVLTHEMGHAVGLSHEEGLHSTMFYQEFYNQHQISCDERAGAQSHYPNIPGSSAISGKILAPSGSPLFGVHVIAISHARGSPLSSALSDKDGTFALEGLEAGNYSILFEPYYPGAANLTAYYSGMNHAICSSSFFPRQMDTRTFSVGAGAVTGLGDLSMSCATNFIGVNSGTLNDLSHPIEQGALSDGASTVWSGVFNTRTELFYGFTTTGGNIRVHSLANTFYSFTQGSVQLTDDVGNVIAPSVNQYPRYSVDGFTNYDHSTQYANLPAGHYVLRIKRNSVPSRELAGGSQLLDNKQFFIVALSQDVATPLASHYPDNVKCQKVLPPSSYVSPTPPAEKPKGGCGSIQAVGGSDGGSSWTSFGALLPYLLMGLMLRFGRRRFNLFK
ncbi:MAG: carboxypeptidase regulatory-like domain-containing protein [Xanthomonadaceae bacterium]|nr:carboxypeptidase regulatory-like domain-containing protein [Xanthomonadaceae bacterium]